MTFRVIEHRTIAEGLTKKEAEKIVLQEESIADLNEVWFEAQKEETI